MFFLEDVMFWFEIIKWLILFYIAFYLYNWAQEHIPFSPILALAVAVILIYYLVIEHPYIGVFGVGLWILVTSGILYMVGTLFPWVGVLYYKMKTPKMERE
ncbi:hypothetical protein HY991_03700 [Candidatus Micrarchaeota archaeon]|nr:hypothetical protein [Candidatus Micrarchaeota archaeon]